ncbi:2-aminoethylphosphonate--pyruvate transaminase [Paenibacillus sp. MBLB4367]|uniref:2-aminoethylphosphonate--pyruvate transaminase n=1 Tax=Paenibacillus sp. MBLB4367 TaxID=3384767 RepID=UPI003907EDD3
MNNRTIPLPDNPYLLLTPGPLTTTKAVKAAMLRDWCTWDNDYNGLVQDIRAKLVRLASASEPERYTTVLMQGSGTFSVESVIGSVVPQDGKLLVLVNGAYGKRIAQIAEVLRIETAVIDFGELAPVNAAEVETALAADAAITHVAIVHTETTTGMLNPLAEIARTVKAHGKTFIVDAMSSFGGVELDAAALGIDYLISSANKCIQGVPGFGYIIADKETLKACEGRARSLSLDLYDQWATMEKHGGKWRFTSPTHVVRAFAQALLELEAEGGIAARAGRYAGNQAALAAGMERLGFRALLPEDCQSPIITAFLEPESAAFAFGEFYSRLKQAGFVIYPGKLTHASTFRIGNIGDVHAADIERLLEAVEANRFW